jgi:hypothetical protein
MENLKGQYSLIIEKNGNTTFIAPFDSYEDAKEYGDELDGNITIGNLVNKEEKDD